MLQAQNSFVPPNAAGNFEDPPYLGTIPKFAPARRAAWTGRQVAGGTELDSMPDSGPWLDQRFAGPCISKKRDAWSIARHAHKYCAVRIHRTPRRQRFHPLHRSIPIEAKWMTSSRVTKGFYVNEAGQQQSSPGFLTQDSWTDPVIKSTVTWVGYTFLELADGAAEHLKTSTEPAHMASFTPWPADAERSSSVEGSRWTP